MIHITKKMYVLVLLLCSVIFGIQAQSAEDAVILEKMSEALTEKYDQQLNLTEEQQTVFQRTVKKFLLDSEMIHSEKISFADKAMALQKNSHKENEAMSHILTKEQLTKYESLKSDYQRVGDIDGYVIDEDW